MENKINRGGAGLDDLLKLFEENISVSDINSSRYLGKISAAIVKKRTELDMTQKEFAKHMEVSQGMVSKWEGGDYNFSIKALAEIAEKLDMELYVNLKPSREKMTKQKAEKKQVYLYTKSEQTNYNISAKSNVIRFIDKQSYVNEKNKKVYNQELIEL